MYIHIDKSEFTHMELLSKEEERRHAMEGHIGAADALLWGRTEVFHLTPIALYL